MNRGILAAFGVAVFFAILFGGLTFNSAMATPPAKVDICHTDPDNDGAGLETISISERAVQKHIDHGDHTGACFVCGDSNIDSPTETCDDGNAVTEQCAYGDTSCTVCASTCTEQAGATSFCGDSTVDGANGEQCDDGGTTPGDGCDATCQIEAGPSTCETCINTRDTGISDCSILEPDEIPSCNISVETTFGSCLATCTGDFGPISEFCINDTASVLSECLATAVTLGNWLDCLDLHEDAIEACIAD